MAEIETVTFRDVQLPKTCSRFSIMLRFGPYVGRNSLILSVDGGIFGDAYNWPGLYWRRSYLFSAPPLVLARILHNSAR